MQIVTPQEMARVEKLAYADGADEAEFMEAAGRGTARVVQNFVGHRHSEKWVFLLCGTGNNGGDAYVAGRILQKEGYLVEALQLAPVEQCSPLLQANHEEFVRAGGVVDVVSSAEGLTFPERGVILDAIFGTGFRGKAEGLYKDMIEAANASGLPIIAVDIPSGLNGSTGAVEGAAISAVETAYLGLPKQGFFLEEGFNHVGALRSVHFGLDEEYIEQAEGAFRLLARSEVRQDMPSLVTNRHKYQAGHVMGLAGSAGMPGAAMLSATAALRSGAGIVHLFHPDGMQAELAACPYEVIRAPYQADQARMVVERLNTASSVFLGPGIGCSSEMRQLLKRILDGLQKPAVIDADGLNIIAEEGIYPPSGSVITPHLGEMHRLLGLKDKQPLSEKFVQQCQEYVERHECVLVLKGAPTFVMCKGEPVHVCAQGDPGMATAGSGDVLTGLIAALLAQGLAPRDAACVGCYLHGTAGEFAARELTSYCMVASDITQHFPDAFRCVAY